MPDVIVKGNGLACRGEDLADLKAISLTFHSGRQGLSVTRNEGEGQTPQEGDEKQGEAEKNVEGPSTAGLTTRVEKILTSRASLSGRVGA